MTLGESLREAITYLEAHQTGSPRMNAEVLLMFVLVCNRAYLYAHPERELAADEHERYEDAVSRRARGFPSQYITGHTEFWGLDFLVNPSVLIPRPETEHAVETVLELAKLMDFDDPQGRPKLIDVGTGSGAIALALAHELPNAEVHASELSPEALEVARINAAKLGMDSRVRFSQSDVLASIVRDASYDFVVSNPPYVALSEADKVQDVVKKFEPHMAVFAGEVGLDIIHRLIPQAHEALRSGGYLVMEIGYSMSEAVMQLMADWQDVHAVPDLAGIPRVVVARKS